MKKPILTLAVLLFTSSISSRACDVVLSQTTKSAYDVEQEVRNTRGYLVCVDSDRFSAYDIQQIANLGASFRLSLRENSFSAYDLDNIVVSTRAAGGKFLILVNSDRLSGYDLQQIAAKSASLELSLKNSNLSAYDIHNIAVTTRQASAEFHLRLDSNRLSGYDIQQIGGTGASLEVSLSENSLSAYDLGNIAVTTKNAGGQFLLLVNSDRIGGYDLQQLGGKGLTMRLNAKENSLGMYDIKNIADTTKQAGGTFLFLVNSPRIGGYDLQQFGTAGHNIIFSLTDTTMGAYDLRNITASAVQAGAHLRLLVNSSRLSSYDLDQIRAAGADLDYGTGD